MSLREKHKGLAGLDSSADLTKQGRLRAVFSFLRIIMANSLATCTILAKEGLAVLENMLGFASGVNRDWEDEFTGNQSRGYSPGLTINIKKPPRYTYRAGRVSVPQSTTETTVPLTLSQGGTDMSFLSVEKTLSLQSMEQKVQAAMATIANEIDRQGLALVATTAYNLVNDTGAAPTTTIGAVQLFTNANRRLDEMAAPRDKQRMLVASPGLNAGLVSGLSGLFNAQPKLSNQYTTGLVVDSLGMNVTMDQNVATQTNGAATASNAAMSGQSGASITVSAIGAGTLAAGTIVNFPGVYAVNPQSRVSTGVLMDFVTTAAVAQNGTSIPISPSMVTTGAFQNCTASTTSANFTIRGAASTAYQCNVAMHKDAYTLACVPIWTPAKGVIDSASASYKGMNMRVVQFYDGVNDNSIFRFDVLFGWAATYPELACKIYSI